MSATNVNTVENCGKSSDCSNTEKTFIVDAKNVPTMSSSEHAFIVPDEWTTFSLTKNMCIYDFQTGAKVQVLPSADKPYFRFWENMK
jgi:hypothetical protein